MSRSSEHVLSGELGDYTENRLNDETVSLSEKSEVKEKSGVKEIYFYSWLCSYCIDSELLTTRCFGSAFLRHRLLTVTFWLTLF